VGTLIRNHLSVLLERGEVRDPRIRFVSMTDVDVTPDERYAKIFVRVLGTPEEQEQALAALNHAAGFLRTELARGLRLRHMPELSFHLDQTLEYGNRIDALLEEIRQSEQSDEQQGEPADGE
jgi:ribosome-binding factor A